MRLPDLGNCFQWEWSLCVTLHLVLFHSVCLAFYTSLPWTPWSDHYPEEAPIPAGGTPHDLSSWESHVPTRISISVSNIFENSLSPCSFLSRCLDKWWTLKWVKLVVCMLQMRWNRLQVRTCCIFTSEAMFDRSHIICSISHLFFLKLLYLWDGLWFQYISGSFNLNGNVDL